MKKTALSLLLIAASPLVFSSSVSADEVTVSRYQVTFPAGDRVAYQGHYAEAFPQGFPVGIGSGLVFTGRKGDELQFTTITDRGPNADAPEVNHHEAKIFAVPDFSPLLMTVRVTPQAAQVTEARKLHDDQGVIKGLPLPAGVIGSTGEVALNDVLQPVTGDNRGLDTEGITQDGQGGYWISDEYGPFPIHIDQQGKVLEKYGPTPASGEQAVANGLPGIIKWRQPNRGFEGVTRLPDGRLLLAVQSTLDIEGNTKNSAQFTRLVTFDPVSGKTAMYGYPIDVKNYRKAKDAKIGDVVAVDNQRILLVEQGSDKEKQMINKIYLVDLSKATELTPFDKQGQWPELDDAATLSSRGITLADKQEIVDLRKLGWQQEKVEGLALIDRNTMAVINDNDFGLEATLVDPAPGVKKIADYQWQPAGTLAVDGKPVNSCIELRPLTPPASQSELWLIKLASPLP
ncbi:MAG: hypothetical protein XXXJIFNMEKO3_02289 [Candidatus Erwinia impunctatus]|nr:hypothetical protein XXXJIFNMEKO_02289 [Culicoides impunctatus]